MISSVSGGGGVECGGCRAIGGSDNGTRTVRDRHQRIRRVPGRVGFRERFPGAPLETALQRERERLDGDFKGEKRFPHEIVAAAEG